MSNELHTRAEKLIAQQRVEGISREENAWLDAHLRECTDCAQLSQRTDAALRSLRQNTIPLPAGLAERTKFRVHLRAEVMREREPQRRLLWFTCAMSWVLGVTSAPYVWRGFAWLGDHTGAPKLLLQVGFGLWWAIPALFAAAIVLLEHARQTSAPDWSNERN